MAPYVIEWCAVANMCRHSNALADVCLVFLLEIQLREFLHARLVFELAA
jgi:hypothetical protein